MAHVVNHKAVFGLSEAADTLIARLRNMVDGERFWSIQTSRFRLRVTS